MHGVTWTSCLHELAACEPILVWAFMCGANVKNGNGRQIRKSSPSCILHNVKNSNGRQIRKSSPSCILHHSSSFHSLPLPSLSPVLQLSPWVFWPWRGSNGSVTVCHDAPGGLLASTGLCQVPRREEGSCSICIPGCHLGWGASPQCQVTSLSDHEECAALSAAHLRHFLSAEDARWNPR